MEITQVPELFHNTDGTYEQRGTGIKNFTETERQVERSTSIGLVQPSNVSASKGGLSVFETFPFGPNWSIQFLDRNFREFWLNGSRP